MKRPVLCLALGAIAGVVFPCAMAPAVQYVAEDFRDSSAPGWTFVTGLGNGPSLTAAGGADPVGDGWLRLTNDVTNQASFVYCNTAIPTNAGLIFTFDFVIWSGSSSVADGLTLAIFDATVTPAAGGYGGSLGYAQRSGGIDGLAGGIAGFAFDEFGNFSNPTEGRVGGPGRTQNAVAIRGSQGPTRDDGYAYQTGTGSLTGFSFPNAASRTAAVVHTVRITIPTSKLVSVEWKPEGGAWATLINQHQCTLNCPAEIKFGYTAGTGASRAYHEIRNLTVTNVPEPATLGLLCLGGLVLAVRRRAHG